MSLQPIPFEKFQKNGWTENTFFKYLTLCEQIRAIGILSSLIPNDQDQYVSSILKKYSHKLIGFLFENCYIVDFDEFIITKELICSNISIYPYKIPYSSGSKDKDLNTFLYYDPDSFRGLLEYFVSRFLCSKPLIPKNDDDISLNEAESKLNYLEYLQKKIEKNNYLSTPDINRYSGLVKWYKEQLNYKNLFLAEGGPKYRNKLEAEIDKQKAIIGQQSDSLMFQYQKHTLYICKGKIQCLKQSHSIICVTAKVPTIDNELVTLNVNYCRDCQKFFLDYVEYENYCQIYHGLIGKFQLVTAGYKMDFNNRKPESILRLCGYSVSCNSFLSTKDRQKILKSIIDNKILQKHQLAHYLSVFIITNGKRTGNEIARKKWKEDLDFVESYEMNTQPIVYIDNIQKY